MILLDIFARGALIVCLMSWNTTLLANGKPLAIAVGFLISAVWWMNARSASKASGALAGFVYAVGAAFGTAIGLLLGRWTM